MQRLRPNLLLDVQSSGRFLEDEWLGRTLRVGTVELRIVDRCERCVMVGHPQTALQSRPRLLKTIGKLNGACAGVYAEVIAPGELKENDRAHLA